VQVYFAALIIFEVSLVDVIAESLLSEELPLLHAANTDAATSINEMIAFLML
jgi:hypothetical protein